MSENLNGRIKPRLTLADDITLKCAFRDMNKKTKSSRRMDPLIGNITRDSPDQRIRHDEEKRRRKQPLAALPPCLVCGAVSSGVHFGVVTCDSCKTFFRRSLKWQPEYLCSRKENCTITPEKRINCSYCRLQKCQEIGMSKSGTKKGRHTNVQKKDLREMVAKHEEEAQTVLEEDARQKKVHREMIERTIERLQRVHQQHIMMTPEIKTKAKERLEQNMVERRAAEDILGPIKNLTFEEVRQFYRSTGIDLTGCVAAFMSCAKNCTQQWAMQYINYLRSLEEFMGLSLPDRVITLKGASYIWSMVTEHQIANAEYPAYACSACGACYTEDQFSIFGSENKYRASYSPAVALKKLNLTEGETAVLRAFVVFDTSQNIDDVEEPEKVNRVQNLFLECLLHVLEQSRGKKNASILYIKIIEVITAVRSFIGAQLDQLLEMMEGTKFPRIAGEVFGIPESLLEDSTDALDNV